MDIARRRRTAGHGLSRQAGRRAPRAAEASEAAPHSAAVFDYDMPEVNTGRSERRFEQKRAIVSLVTDHVLPDPVRRRRAVVRPTAQILIEPNGVIGCHGFVSLDRRKLRGDVRLTGHVESLETGGMHLCGLPCALPVQHRWDRGLFGVGIDADFVSPLVSCAVEQLQTVYVSCSPEENMNQRRRLSLQEREEAGAEARRLNPSRRVHVQEWTDPDGKAVVVLIQEQ